MALRADRLAGWWARLRAAPALGLALPLALAAAAYARVLPAEFVFDDDHAIVSNPAVKDLGAFLGAAPWRGALAGGRPVADLTFALNYAFAGLEPWNYHLTNVAIHLAAVALAWVVARRLLRLAGAARADGVALAAAGLFALHPLQSQAVSYVVQRAESLAAALWLAALACLLAAEVRPPGRGRALRLAAALGLFLLGLGTKATVVTLPAAWLLVAALVPAPAARAGLMPWRTRALAALPFLAVGAGYAAALIGALDEPHAGLGVPGLSPGRYLLTQLPVMATYLRLLAWPTGQRVDWHLTPEQVLAGPWPALAGLLLAALAAGALWLALRARARDGAGAAAARVAGAGVLWFFLTLAPTSSVIPVVDLLMEHRAYLPSLGIFLAAAVGAERAAARLAPRRPWLPAAACAAAWLALAAALHARNAAWENPRALWSAEVASAPENARAWVNLALAASDEGRSEEAVRIARQALPLAEREPVVLVRLLGNLGIELGRLNRLEEAEEVLRRAVAIQPWTTLLNDLAAVLVSRGKLDEAEAILAQALTREPGHPECLASVGKIRLMRGDAAGALEVLERAVAADPDGGLQRLLLARALERTGRPEAACQALRAIPRRAQTWLAGDIRRDWRRLGCGP